MMLRPYQEVAIADACKALDKHKNTIVVAPTGAGKTIMLSALVGKRFKNGDKVLVLNIGMNLLIKINPSSRELMIESQLVL